MISRELEAPSSCTADRQVVFPIAHRSFTFVTQLYWYPGRARARIKQLSNSSIAVTELPDELATIDSNTLPIGSIMEFMAACWLRMDVKPCREVSLSFSLVVDEQRTRSQCSYSDRRKNTNILLKYCSECCSWVRRLWVCEGMQPGRKTVLDLVSRENSSVVEGKEQ